jgi:REP element-mobilizing transposase RayT
MARPLRLEYPGAVYHVMARGHERSTIYRDTADREKFLALLGSIAQDEPWVLHAYCLMGNHYHLLVETPQGGISRGMRSVNGRYTQWFNHRHERAGHLFEGRFRSVLVQRESHLLELVRYVVLNPVRAKLVEHAGDWRWSSYRATVGREEGPAWLELDWTLSQFAPRRPAAREAFRQFVAQGRDAAAAVARLEGHPYLGDSAFLKKVQRMVEGRESGEEIPLRFRKASGSDLETIRRAVAKEWRVTPESLSRRRGGAEKKAGIYLARKLTRLRGREIGHAFGVRAARVSNVVTEIEQGRDASLSARVERLRARLSGV